MVENIKSNFFMRDLFSLVEDGKQLQLVKYNKSLQKILFDGEYLNNKRWNGKLFDPKNNNIYEIKNGSGSLKEYNYFCDLVFEGEYLNGERWNGKGEEVYKDFNFIWEIIEYSNGKKKVIEKKNKN